MYHQPYKKDKKQNNLPLITRNKNQSSEKIDFIQKNKDLQSQKRLAQKNIVKNANIPKSSTAKTIPQKVQHLQKAVERLSKGVRDSQMQNLLLQQIKGIKSQLKQIKQQMGLSPTRQSNRKGNHYEKQQDNQEQYQQNIANLQPRQQSQIPYQNPVKSIKSHTEIQQTRFANNKSNVQIYQTKIQKQMIEIGKIQPYMKEFKLQNEKMLRPMYRGYHKKSSKPVIIKYCKENQAMDPIINLYQKLWKNIVKAKKICINKIYDLNEPLASNILALQMNKLALHQIELPPLEIIKSVLRGIQFFHQCGYLYRNIHPEHIMMSFQGNIVLLDLKMMRRFTDIKGKLMEVRGNLQTEGIHEFISNSRLRGLSQYRKDDLQCLGYLALYLLQGRLPWNSTNILQVRSKLTLQTLYGKYGNLLQFMIIIHKMNNEQTPNYDNLYNLLNVC